MENKDWIKELKVGDKVYVSDNGYSLTTVKKFTPTGKIRTESGHLFDDEGYCGSSNTWVRPKFLKPWTQELEDKFKSQRILNDKRKFLQQRNWDAPQYTPEIIEQVYDILINEKDNVICNYRG